MTKRKIPTSWESGTGAQGKWHGKPEDPAARIRRMGKHWIRRF
jgi:hypothetical protein